MTNHQVRDLDKLEVAAKSWCPLDWWDARNRRQKGNYPGYAGYRQRGRAEMRIAKRRKTRIERRIGKMICDEAQA